MAEKRATGDKSGRFRKSACEYTEIEDWVAIELLPAKMGLLLGRGETKLCN